MIKILIFMTLAGFSNAQSSELKLNDVPAEVLKLCLDEYGKIADIDELWDDSCVSVKNGSPRSKFVLACQDKKSFYLICHKGGFSANTVLYSFNKVGPKWMLVKEKSKFLITEKLDCLKFKKYFH